MYEAICVLLFFLQKIIKTHIVIWKDIRISKNIYLGRYPDIWNMMDISHPIFVSDIRTILFGSEIRICYRYPKNIQPDN
jgi:hypothetical protein